MYLSSRRASDSKIAHAQMNGLLHLQANFPGLFEIYLAWFLRLGHGVTGSSQIGVFKNVC